MNNSITYKLQVNSYSSIGTSLISEKKYNEQLDAFQSNVESFELLQLCNRTRTICRPQVFNVSDTVWLTKGMPVFWWTFSGKIHLRLFILDICSFVAYCVSSMFSFGLKNSARWRVNIAKPWYIHIYVHVFKMIRVTRSLNFDVVLFVQAIIWVIIEIIVLLSKLRRHN